jgi:hypothetical protein
MPNFSSSKEGGDDDVTFLETLPVCDETTFSPWLLLGTSLMFTIAMLSYLLSLFRR